MKCSKCNKDIVKNNFIITNGEYVCLDCLSDEKVIEKSQDNNQQYKYVYVSDTPDFSKEEIIPYNKTKNKQSMQNTLDNVIYDKLEFFNEDNSKPTLKEPIDKKTINGIDKRISIWKEKLIDLSKRNRLLNFRQTKGSTLKIIDEIPPEIFRMLYCKNAQMKFLHINVNEENVDEELKLSREELNEGIEFKAQEFTSYKVESLNKKHVDKFLQTCLSKKDLEKTLRKISTTAKNTMNDLGFNVLFLTLGSVIWYEDDNSDTKFESPLLLLPVSISRNGVGDDFIIEYNDEDVILNPALMLKFKRDFRIILEDIDTSDIEEKDIIKIFETVQEKINNHKKWRLLNNCYIGLFSFAKFVMYKDLDTYQDKIKSNNLVKCICGYSTEKVTDINQAYPVEKLDTNVLPQDTYQILDADSSQQQAIAFVKKNNNLVIEGPPGTGKSQTIANIIAELLSQGKKVLFVSQKIAALEVVQNRLEANGLAPYCLELHSNKINRKQVLQNLIDSINTHETGHEVGSSLDILQEKRIELNDYVQAVHTSLGKLNITPFEAIGKVCINNDIPDLEYIFDNYEEWDKETLDYKKSLFTNFKNIIKLIGNPKSFSWYGSYIKDIDSDYRKKLEIKELFKKIIEDVEYIKPLIDKLAIHVCKDAGNTYLEINKMIECSKAIQLIPKNLFKKGYLSDENLISEIDSIIKIINEYNTCYNSLIEKYNLEILNENIDNLIEAYKEYNNRFISKISFAYLKHNNLIKKYLKSSYKPNSSQVLADLLNIKDLNGLKLDLYNVENSAQDILSTIWHAETTNVEDISRLKQNIIKFKNFISDEVFNTDILEFYKSHNVDYEEFDNITQKIQEVSGEIEQNFKQMANCVKFDYNEVFETKFENIDFNAIKNKIQNMLLDIDNLMYWNQYLITIDKIKSENLDKFYEKFLDSKIDLELIDTVFEVQFLRVWLNDFVYQKSNILRRFDSAQHNELISQFKKLDKALIRSAKSRLVQKLYTNMINAKNDFRKEVSDLEREGKLQRLRKSLRQIIKMLPNLLLRIKPCLMMSPLTVSQLLDPDLFNFDYVIFDEASQLTTEDCIGSIIRGKKLIVAGDSQQMPPTSFFKTVTEPSEDSYDDENSENYVKEDLDSILDECSSSGFPKCMLKWHYRSRDEHLIAFSNKHLYKELYTFPSSVETSDEMGIKWHYHENTQNTDCNARLEEARIVARAVIEHAKKFPNYSLGVATFNIKQKDLIEDEIANLLNEDKSCANFFNPNKEEPFFVKNLESVQGDERDVIMISMGYFKNQNGVLSMFFGPLNSDGGERRLNVLITRARYKVEIFSAIRYVDFNLDRTDSRGVALLKQYLEFAERGEVALLSNTTTEIDDHFDSPFEESVCNALRESGYYVKTQVGCSGYKIDLAVRDPINPGQFVLGIECDGASYHSSATARDRDRLRQQVLENLGWKIYRIWSTDWFKNPQREKAKLLKYIENIKIKNELMEEQKV
ncbi:DUF4011 domain-containing protein [bacterium]|nr:DUF4011 domain-containing protein [bacterium]